MHLPRSLLLALCGFAAASAAQAIGFGRPPANVVLGSPLNFTLPLRVEPGETFEPECIQADAQFGDRRVPPHNLRWAVEPGSDAGERLVRVISLVAVDEPVVTVQVSTGCQARITRRFTAFADPPFEAAAPPAVAEVLASPPPARRSATVPAARPQPRPVAAALPASAPQPRAKTRRTADRSQPPRARVAQAPAAPKAPARPRLALDSPDPTVIEKAVAAALSEQQASAVQAAAQSAHAADAAASAAVARVKSLEQQVEQLLAEGRTQREQLQALRNRASAGDAASRWLPWLLLALGVMALLLVALLLKLRQARRDTRDRWWADAATVLADAKPDPQPPARPAVVRPPEPAPEAALDFTLPSEPFPNDDIPPAALTTQQQPPTLEPWSQTGPPPRPVSAEELIDLEQQAEFFVVLGQDEAAIDLLVSHLRDSGGTSPLPYLKLLEIHRRRGEREAYERTRTRFNQRFNAYAPDWGTDMQHGRSLDAYPQVMQQLQRAWPSPIDAMAELETLLFRKKGGELFDLPAYRELLLLYSLARDLLDTAGTVQGPEVDVLLPLPSQAMDATAALPHLSLVGETTMVLTPDVMLERPTQFHTIDLDISEGPPTAPGVAELDQRDQRRRR